MKRAFTILELITVITLIIIVSTMAIIGGARLRSNSRLSRVDTELTTLVKSIDQYLQDNNFQYPSQTARGVIPAGLATYLPGNSWPSSPWPHGVYDWNNFVNPNDSSQVYQMAYHLCATGDPVSYCQDSYLFPTFTQNSGILYCISGTCVASPSAPTDPAFCVNCKNHYLNY